MAKPEIVAATAYSGLNYRKHQGLTKQLEDGIADVIHSSAGKSAEVVKQRILEARKGIVRNFAVTRTD